MKKILFVAMISILIFIQSCQSYSEKEGTKQNNSETLSLFPKGQKGSNKFFTGNVYHYALVPPDSTFTTLSGNVYFEPGTRSHWHKHPSGQILIVTEGTGYHQIKGQPKEIIKKGDVVKCPPNTLHWHGASSDSALQHIYMIPNTERGIVEWKEAVTDEEYYN